MAGTAASSPRTPGSLVDVRTGEEAINRGLAKRLAQLAAERERRERAAEKADAEFSVEFLNAARKCFEMIDVDESGTLEKAEIVEAVTSNKKVISFLVNCGNKNLQYLLVPVRLEAALTAMDTDRDGHIDIDEWETCIEDALKNKLAARAAKRELDAKNAAKEIEEFTNEFLSAARRCFELIDKDGGGTLSTAEIVEAVKNDAVAHAASYDRAPFNLRGLRDLRRNCCFRVFGVWWCGIGLHHHHTKHTITATTNTHTHRGTTERPRHTSRRSQKVIKFLKTCGEENLQFLLHPPRLQKALEILDTDKSGEVDADEWRVARRPPSGFVSFV